MQSRLCRPPVRRAVTAVLALLAAGVLAGGAQAATARVSAPKLAAGFDDTFKSRFVEVGGVRLHAVVGGEGPPLLLVHGWPETWYAWRHIMPALAKHYTVVAVDQRGIGRSGKPATGYDTRTLANDLVGLMDKLGHERFAVVGHDTGFAISYALAADHPERVARVALAEIPGPPLASHAPPLLLPDALNNRLWHLSFNRVDKLAEQLITGNEDPFFRYEFEIQGGKVPEYAVKYYIGLLKRPGALRGSLGWYRALEATIAQNEQRKATPLGMPVLAIGGARSYGADVAGAMMGLAANVQGVVIPGAGHWVAEEAPRQTLAALTAFLAPYRAE